MNETDTVELKEKKLLIKEFSKKLKECERDSKEEESIYIELNNILNSIVNPIVTNGKSDVFITEINALNWEELMIPRNIHNAIFIEDIASHIKNRDYDKLSDEEISSIFKVFDYMINNNIRSYKID